LRAVIFSRRCSRRNKYISSECPSICFPFSFLKAYVRGTKIEIYKIKIYNVVKNNTFVYVPTTITNSSEKISYFKKGWSFYATSLVTFLSTLLQKTTPYFWVLEHYLIVHLGRLDAYVLLNMICCISKEKQIKSA